MGFLPPWSGVHPGQGDGLVPGRSIEILASPRARDLSVYFRMPDDKEWTRCAPSFTTLRDARDYAETVQLWPGAMLRVVGHGPSRQHIERVILGLKGYELERRGIVRTGAFGLRGGSDEELDRMWNRTRSMRRHRVDREPPLDDVDLPRGRMLRSLRLEFVGHDLATTLRIPKMRPWVAQVVFDDGRVTEREFAAATTDYADADKTGGRGVMHCYLLRQGIPYEVFDRARQLGPRRVFMIHDGHEWLDITRECAIRCAASS